MAASFERGALGLLLAVVAAGSIAAAVISPFEFGAPPNGIGQAHSDRAGALPPGIEGAVGSPETEQLDRNAATGAELVPYRIGWPAPPEDAAPRGESQRTTFIEQLLPLVWGVNEEVSAERARLWNARQRASAGELAVEDRLWLASMAEKYGTAASDVTELTRRIDAVPASILIAAAASSTNWDAMDEHGWRTLFRAVTGAASAIPTAATAGWLRPPESPLDALRLYLWILNTHVDFSPFRRARERLRHEGVPMLGSSLAGTLPRVAPGKLPGALILSELVADQRLERFDIPHLVPGEPDEVRRLGMAQPSGLAQELGE